MRIYILLFLLSPLFLLSACSGVKTEAKYPTGMDRNAADQSDIYGEEKSIFGDGGLFSVGKKKYDGTGGTSGINVNSFLWRASLDTVSFMPLVSADPFGGTILTDWYSPEGVNNERFKANVFILTRQLRSDGIRVRIFKQVLRGGTWHDTTVSNETVRQLEDAILTRARQLRVAQIGTEEE